MFCYRCGSETTENTLYCHWCGARVPGVQTVEKKGLSTAAGILDIAAGGFSILSFIGMAGIMLFMVSVGGEIDVDAGSYVMSGISLIGGLVAIVAGILLLRRRSRAMAITGAVGSTLTLLTLNPVGVAALVVTIIARRDFER